MLKTLLKLSPIFKYQISGNSMIPILKHGQVVLVNRLSYFLTEPKIGDLVALIDPRDKKVLIKRLARIKNYQYFVLGENKKQSTDSRAFGWLKKKDIIGKIIFKINSRFEI